MENFSLKRLSLVEVGETEAKIYDGDVSANSAGDSVCESGAVAKILRENTIQLFGGLSLHIPPSFPLHLECLE